jgi:membrane-associated phospholipid phosphatase
VLVLLLGGRAMAAPATNDPEAQPAPSGAAPVLDGRVPLAAGFPPAELAGIGAAASWYVALVAFQRPIVTGLLGGTDARGCERCRLGAPGQLDRDVSEALYRGPDAAPLFGRFPDRLGMAIGPAVAGLFYLEDALLLWSTGRGVTGNRHADHELVALVEAFALAMAVNQTVKVSTGRLRPYYELGRSPSLPPPPDTNLSFFSGHATSAFTLAAFVSRDLGDWLAVRPLARAAPAARILVGRVVPAVALYGAASLVAVSRIVDQAHYLTDVALGAAVGSLVGNLVYALHFDTAGAPRRLGASAATARLHPLPGGVALAGEY